MVLGLELPEGARDHGNFVGGEFTALGDDVIPVHSPYTGALLGRVGVAGAQEIERAVSLATEAQFAWGALPLRERSRPLFQLRSLLIQHQSQLASLVALESGKTQAEAAAGIERGLEVVEFALGLCNSETGAAGMVSRGVSCEYRRTPLGVVAGITPFNFPVMVPLWMIPLATTVGNAFILKPSDKVPLSACRLAELMQLAGYPPGVFSVIHGGKSAVDALVQHPGIAAVALVGSTPVARSVYAGAAAAGKRALCLGGAKNHLIVMPDADRTLSVKAVVDSFTGCAGQRCMAGSVLVTVGRAASIIPQVVEAARSLQLGTTLGALINQEAQERLTQAVARAQEDGATVLLDGRLAVAPIGFEGGHWFGPTVLDHAKPDFDCAKRELFGPILTVIHVDTLEEALALDGTSPYGNATSIFTQNGAIAREVAERTHSGMVGVNVGVPVPRDPYSFGGTRGSKFGHGEITGQGAVEFWSNLKKITTKWAPQSDSNWMS